MEKYGYRNKKKPDSGEEEIKWRKRYAELENKKKGQMEDGMAKNKRNGIQFHKRGRNFRDNDVPDIERENEGQICTLEKRR